MSALPLSLKKLKKFLMETIQFAFNFLIKDDKIKRNIAVD